LQQQLGGGATVVTLFPDSNKKYLTTDLCRHEPEKPEYLSPDIELIGFDVAR
jgi:cysteine synthase A